MIKRTPIRHNLTVNEDVEILDSIIHFLLYADEEYDKHGCFDVPSLNHMVDVLFERGYNEGMVGYVETLCERLGRRRPWRDSPKDFFSSDRAVNYLNNLKNQLV